MGQFVSLVIFVAVLAFISIFVDRWWQARKQEQEGEVTESVTTRVNARFKAVLNKFKLKKASNLTEQFQNWVKATKLDKALKSWLESLSDDETKAFVKDLATFCTKLDLDLAWLGESTLDNEPDVKKLLETSVVAYCTTQWNAVQANADVTLLKTWLTVQEKPNKKKHQQLYNKLFSELVDKKIIKVNVVDYIDLSEKEQKQQKMELVNKAAEDNKKAFNVALKDVLTSDNEEESTVVTSATAPASA